VPAFVPGSKQRAKRPKDVGKWCDANYFDGLKDPRGYTDLRYDHRKGYGLTFWTDGFLGSAREIAQRYSPLGTFLELGCAKGFLVQAMRMIGVEAYGVDVSEYALSHSHPDIRQFLHRHSAADLSAFPDNYFDLVWSWDFMEHLDEDEIISCLKESLRVSRRRVVHNLTAFDREYGSIAEAFPDEPQDPTHVSCHTKGWGEALVKEHVPAERVRAVEYIGDPFREDAPRRAMLMIDLWAGEFIGDAHA